jgi:DNA-binding transcriptional regulator YdaS (Cro superfamily)
MTETDIHLTVNIRKVFAELASVAGKKAAADALGISPQYFADILNGNREPGPKALEVLGLERRIIYLVKEQPADE